jgi:hypothetical protein
MGSVKSVARWRSQGWPYTHVWRPRAHLLEWMTKFDDEMKFVQELVADARRYHFASPIRRIEIEIEWLQCWVRWGVDITDQMAVLQRRKAELLRSRPDVARKVARCPKVRRTTGP